MSSQDRARRLADKRESFGPEVKSLRRSEIAMQSPLSVFDSIRPRILEDVVERARGDVPEIKIENELTAALYLEKQRLNRDRGNLFTKSRINRDRALWNKVQSELLNPSDLAVKQKLLDQVLSHYADEIGGHFNQGVYQFATKIIPVFFSALLNAAAKEALLFWKMKHHVSDRLRITGEVEHLRKLSQKGTILLVPTHQSNIDSILIGYVIYLMGLPPFAYGAGLNLFSNPMLSFFMSNLGAYTVDRQKSNSLYKLVLKNYSTRILREGVHSIFFPGGGRARSGAVESRLKLGLLGTALEAQLENLKQNRPKPNVYVVPMVMSYHFVLEASSLIEDFLADSGKHRYIISDDESSQVFKVLNFFWQVFKGESGMTVRVGSPLDVFGNPVDEDGKSIGPNGTSIDPKAWLTSYGELKAEPQRDREYVRELGDTLVKKFHDTNTILTSHLAAFTFFESLRELFPEHDLYRFLRISLKERTMPWDHFLQKAEIMQKRVIEAERAGMFHLSPEIHSTDVKVWVKDGLKCLGLFHGNAVLKYKEQLIYTEDMNLLYYYRNRLAGYGLSKLADPRRRIPGTTDEKGFLV